MASPTRASDPAEIARRILVLRGHRVLLDSDLAILYGVPTKALNQAVRRNRNRFPDDFCFRISDVEKSEVVTICDHLQRLNFSRTTPLAFTEQRGFMGAAVLNSPRAVDMSVYAVRAFVKLRELLASHTELARKLAALEKPVATLDARTRRQFEEVYGAIRALMAPPNAKSRPIGFTADLDKDR